MGASGSEFTLMMMLLWMDGHAGLADLAVGVAEAGVHRGAAGAHLRVEDLRQVEQHLESFLGAHAVTAGNDDGCALEVMPGSLHVMVQDLHDIGFRTHVAVHLGIDHFPAGLARIESLLHDAGTDRRHLRTVVRIHDRGHDVAAEGGTDLVQELLVGLSGLDVVEITDLELRAVGGEAAGQGGGHARAQVPTDDGRAHQADLRFFLLEKVHENIGMGRGRVREQVLPVEYEQFVHPVREDLGLHGPFDAGAGHHGVQFHAQLVRELADLGHDRALDLAIYEYVIHSLSR